jgi:protein O-GlcNAc transferase
MPTISSARPITPPVFGRWVRLLRSIDDGVLWLLEMGELAARNLRNEARARGVDPQRLVFAPKLEIAQHATGRPIQCTHWRERCVLDRVAGRHLHHRRFRGPRCGKPARGNRFSRAGNAQPRPIRGTRLEARNRALRCSRRKLEANRLTFPLFDTDRLRCHIEQAFKRMWEIFQNGETPRLISIAPLRS